MHSNFILFLPLSCDVESWIWLIFSLMLMGEVFSVSSCKKLMFNASQKASSSSFVSVICSDW